MTTDAPLWTTEDKPTTCTRCNANRQALFALAKAQDKRGMESEALADFSDKVQQVLDRAFECPLCRQAWEKEKAHETPTTCQKCGVNRDDLFAITRVNLAGWDKPYKPRSLVAIEECPLCAAAWKEAKRA